MKLVFPTELPQGVTPEAFHVASLSFMAEILPNLTLYPNADKSIATVAWFIASLYGHAHHNSNEPPCPREDLALASDYVFDQFARFQDIVSKRDQTTGDK